MATNFKNSDQPLNTKLPGNGKQGEFDQVYITEDGKILIMEGKGGNATWVAEWQEKTVPNKVPPST